MRRAVPPETDDDINEFYTSLIQKGQARNSKKRLKFFGRKPAAPPTRFRRFGAEQRPSPSPSDHIRPNSYQRSVLGLTEFPSATHKTNPKQTRYHTITIQFPAFSPANRKKLRSAGRKLLPVLAGILILLIFGLAGKHFLTRSESPKPGVENVAPQSVIVPKNLPDGFSVGSSSQSLENGTVIYLVYDEKGNEVTISQQALPTSMDTGLFSGSLAFETRLGKAYIIETVDRITGYILSTDSMILFNSTDAISSTSLRQLMEAYQP